MIGTCLDTGICAPESEQTLLLQQNQLVCGRRNVQMFPFGTPELELPRGMARCQNERGVFHFNPDKMVAETILKLSREGNENRFLNLGSYSKYDIALRISGGEKLVCITEYTSEGVELRSAAGTNKTCNAQRVYFERTKEPNSVITLGPAPDRVLSRFMKG